MLLTINNLNGTNVDIIEVKIKGKNYKIVPPIKSGESRQEQVDTIDSSMSVVVLYPSSNNSLTVPIKGNHFTTDSITLYKESGTGNLRLR